MEHIADAPLTNLQLELLKLYKAGLAENELLEVSAMLSDYLAKRAIKMADEAWDDQGWDNDKTEQFLKTKMRTSYKNI